MILRFFAARWSALAALLAVFMLIGVFGCGGSGSSGGSATDRGTLEVFMVDAPPDPTITSVEVDINRVEAHVGSSWMVISDGAQTVDLLDIGVTPVQLASELLPVGHYTQIRFFVTQARITDSTGTHIATVPSGTVHINIDHDIEANVVTPLLLDFNLDRSVIKLGNGNYILTPVVPAVIRTDAGTITGIATDGTNPLLNAKVWAVYTAGTNYQLNWPVNMAASKADGTFKIWALLPGTYRLDFTWTDGATTRTATVNDVVVTANQNTDVGTQALN
jgi:hypothetical protein